jgi:outer membrane protein TolC
MRVFLCASLIAWNCASAAQVPTANLNPSPSNQAAQQAATPPVSPSAPAAGISSSTANAAPGDGPLSLSLNDALTRARTYSQQYLAAAIAASSAHEDTLQARAALLPTLNVLNQYIHTQGNGTPSGVFVANDGVHVYNEQAVAHAELFSLSKRADYKRAQAGEVAAKAKIDIAQRGLVATVVQNYYAVITGQRHLANARRSLEEAQRFTDITKKQEAGGEVAHADVIKAQLVLLQRQRELLDAQVAGQKAQIALGVILFSNIDQQYSALDDMSPTVALPAMDEFRVQAYANNPDIRAALATVDQSGFAVKSARGAFYPSLVVDYFYGFDANVFNIRGPENRQNLGYSAQGTVIIPVWNWGATRSKVRQAQLVQKQAEMDLSFARRALQSNVSSFYLEAQAAQSQLESLKSSQDLSAESLRLTILRYQAGEATAFEVSDAQNTLAQARNAYDDGLTRYTVALVNMRTLTGRI